MPTIQLGPQDSLYCEYAFLNLIPDLPFVSSTP